MSSAPAGHDVVAAPEPDVLDIADRPRYRDAVGAARPEAVIHLAAMAYAPDATADAAEAIRVNVGGTLAVVEACRSLDHAPGAAGRRLVGGLRAARSTDAPLTESSPLGPRGVYGLTKLAAEALAVVASATTGWRSRSPARSITPVRASGRSSRSRPSPGGSSRRARQASTRSVPATSTSLATSAMFATSSAPTACSSRRSSTVASRAADASTTSRPADAVTMRSGHRPAGRPRGLAGHDRPGPGSWSARTIPR